jgi:pantoate--beta-alanine ligase
MRHIQDLDALRAELAFVRERGLRVGLVPTMGALHAGHLALVNEAKRHAQRVVVTVFVNPTQFGPGEDFTRYPRDLEGDMKKCASAGADYVFAPADPTVIYPTGDETRVRVPETAKHLEGSFRPHHFEGVATVVAKLFMIAGPCVAVFGRKDYQQLQVVKRMARDLFLDVEIIGHPTVREADGLALSSRNAYLASEERTKARAIPTGLAAAVRAFASGERSAERLVRAVRNHVDEAATSVDYVTCADPSTVAPLADGATVGDRVLLAVAARFGTTRLIDNVVLGEERGPGGETGMTPF